MLQKAIDINLLNICPYKLKSIRDRIRNARALWRKIRSDDYPYMLKSIRDFLALSDRKYTCTYYVYYLY